MRQVANLCEYLEEASGSRPGHLAVMDPSGRRVTYAELHDSARRIAGFLNAHGVKSGDRVGVIGPKSVDCVAVFFGVMMAGAAYVPADFTAPAARNRALLSDCDVKVAFLDRRCAEITDSWPGREAPRIAWLPGPEANGLARGSKWEDVVSHEPLTGHRLAGPDGLAYILYTSGSTGKPKGVTLTQENATSFVEWCSSEFSPVESDRFSSHAPFHFDLSILDLYVSLKHGAQLYLISEDLGKSPRDLAAFIANNGLTVWYSTPSILSLLAQFGGLDEHDCTALRLALFAGEVFPIKHLRSIVERWPQAVFYNLYGPTETNVCTFSRIPDRIPPDRAAPYPIGHLCRHCDGLVLDAPGGSEVAPGEEGLLHIAGQPLFQGYWNRSDPDLFFEREGRRYYNTGDVVRQTPDGYVYVGRRDRMVKRRGYRIELGEIERGLYQNAKIREAAAVAVPDASANVRIVACVVPEPGERPSIIELKTFCGQALPSYMNPDIFVVMDALPRTSTDKVDYQKLVLLNQRAS